MNPDFQVEVQLDRLKHKQKGAVKRALFLDSQQAVLQKRVRLRNGERVCQDTKIYLRVSFSSKNTRSHKQLRRSPCLVPGRNPILMRCFCGRVLAG